jgi:hypothetical protein
MQQHAWELVNTPYLLHAILAFAAGHLAFIQPSQKKYAIAAAYHYQQSLSLYSSHLRTSFDAKYVNQIIGCGHLQTMLAFQNIYLGGSNGDGGGFVWLRAMRGIPTLWKSINLTTYSGGSIWSTVCDESHKGRDEVFCTHKESDDVNLCDSSTCKALHKLCGLAVGSPRANITLDDRNIFQEPLSHLCLLARLDADPDKIGRYVGFVASLSNSFLQVLENKDPRALLIICYFCIYFSEIGQWWITRSAVAECRRICTILETIGDQRILELLQFPAGKCCYLLRDDK